MKRFLYITICTLLSIGAWAQNVAKIGTTEYATLAEAVTAAQTGETIVLLDNITLTASATIGSSANKHARQFTIDFNGNTVTKSSSTIFTIYDDVTLTGNGQIDYYGYGITAFAIKAFGDVTIDGVNITDKKNNAGGILYAGSGATLTLKNGTVTSDKPRSVVQVAKDGNFVMEGGKLISNYNVNNSSAACINVAAGGTASVKGGELQAVNIATWVDGILNIDGGTITSDYNVWVNNGTVNTTDGELNAESTAVYLYIASSKAYIKGGRFEVTGSDKRYLLNKLDAVRNDAILEVTGGTFVGFNPADNAAEGAHTNFVAPDYKSVDNGDGTYSVVEREYVAQIGDKKYESLTEAIEAAQNDETISLLADVTDNITIPAGKNITLDLNGKTLSGGSVASNGKKAAIVNNGTVTIQDSSVGQTGTIKREDDDTSLSASNSYYVIDNQGTMTIKSGNIMNKAGVPGAHKGSSLIRNGEVAAGAVLNIEGGTLTQNYFDVIKNGGNNSVLNITGGTINSANSYAILSYDEVNMTAGEINGNVCLRSYDTDFAVGNITGGTIKGNITVETYPGNTPDKLSECNISGDAVVIGHLSIGEGNGKTFTANDEKGTFAISGGTFSEAVPEQYCAPGYSPVTTPNSDNMYEVETTKVAMIDDARYASLAEAIEAATDGATIKLIRDGLKYELVEPNKTITLDLNGFTYDCNIDNYGTLTITDNSAEGTGKIVNTKKHWIVWNNPAATLTIQNGTIAFETRENAKSDTGQQAIVNEGSLTINGGVIDGYTADYNTGIADSYTDTYAVENINGDVTINGGKLMGLHSLSTFGGTSAVINDGQFIVPFGPGTNAVYNYTDDLTVYIKGGTFIGDTDYLINKNDNSDGSFCITGGKFYKYDPQHSKSENPIANFVPKEYAAQEDADGYFVIVPAIAYIDEMGYAVLDTAIEEAKEAESETTITLLANAETTKETLPANVTINANEKVLTMPSFVVLDGEAITYPKVTGAETYKVHKATYIRTNVNSTVWGTVCLPFSLTSGNGANYYTYNDISGSTLTVDEAETVAPNTPVVFKKATGDLNINETDATVSLNASEASLTSGNLIGTYADADITANGGNIYFINGDTFHKAQVSLKVPMYRAYIKYGAPASPSKLYINVSGEENVDAIGTLTMDNAEVEAVYDAAGRRIQTPQQGLNIMRLANGKTVKVMVK